MTVFYEKEVINGARTLSEEESKHCSQVLRHKTGDEVIIFDGIGGKHRAVLSEVTKKSCSFDILSSQIEPSKDFSIHLAIAPTKNADRMEWLVEKLSELGVNEISLLQTKHSERKKLRTDRLEKKVISAMKQSGNPFKLKINEVINLHDFLKKSTSETKLIAHVDSSHPYISSLLKPSKHVCLLIGPEGDFSKEEVTTAVENGWKPISLGQNTLRTETAGFVACCAVNLVNNS